MKIIQLLATPPFNSGGGLGGYALSLAESLRQHYEINTIFMTYYFQSETQTNNDYEEIIDNDFVCFKINKEDYFNHLLKYFLEEGVNGIILHYIPQASWLLETLKSKKILYKKFKLLIMFHEGITPSGKKGEIISFLTGKEKNIMSNSNIRDLSKIADTAITSNAAYQSVLAKWVKSPICIPIHSTIGEPRYIPPLEKRERRMIVFGSTSTRQRIYKTTLNELIASCHKLEIEEIYDIGYGEFSMPELKDITILKIGGQPPDVISQLMLNSLAGFIDYYPKYLAKSTVLGAYCSHGLIPVCSKYTTSVVDGLEVNKHYLCPKRNMRRLNLSKLQSITDNACEWYNKHNLTKNTDKFVSLLTT